MKPRFLRLNALAWAFLVALFLIGATDQALAHGMSDAEKQSIIDGGNWSYLWLGATHMLSGYDHLAFVFGIIFFLTRFQDIVKYVTAFTIGHSVTLIFATFNAIQMNYFLIDAVIGLSVCYIAFSNLDGFRNVLRINPPNMMAMIVGLGLIHGFGLSTRLQQLPLDPDNLLMNIISFNIGVEFGQITALAAMLAVISLWRNRDSFIPFSLATNYGLIALGAFLFLMQMHDYNHSQEENPATAAVASPTAAPEASTVVLSDQPSSGWQDTFLITLPGGGEKEFKLQVEEGKSFEYAWSTDGGQLFFDKHGEPAGDTKGAFQSYQVSIAPKAEGTLLAPFTGTHGWYWKNETGTPVTITLNVRGDYQPVIK